MRIFILVFLSLLIGVVAAALIAPSFIDWNKYKEPLLKTLNKQTPFKVKIDGNLSFGFLPQPYFIAEQVEILKEEGGAFFSAHTMSLGVALMPLFKREVSVSELNFSKPVINITKLEDGRILPFAYLSSNENKENASDQKIIKDIQISNFSIKDGLVHYKDLSKNVNQRINVPQMNFFMESLEGPYKSTSSIEINDVLLKMQMSTGMLENKITPVDTIIEIGESVAELKYSGIFDFNNVDHVQGETIFKIQDSKKFTDNVRKVLEDTSFSIEKPMSLKGFLSNDDKGFSYRQAALTAENLESSFDVVFDYDGKSEISFKANDLNALLNIFQFSKDTKKQSYLPEDIQIPFSQSVDIKGSVDKFSPFQSVSLKDISIGGALSKENLKMDVFAISDDDMRADLKVVVSGTIKDKDTNGKTIVWNDPVIDFETKLDNFKPVYLKEFLNEDQYSDISEIKIEKYDVKAKGKLKQNSYNIESFSIKGGKELKAQGNILFKDNVYSFHTNGELNQIRLVEPLLKEHNLPETMFNLPLVFNVKGGITKDANLDKLISNFDVQETKIKVKQINQSKFEIGIDNPDASKFFTQFNLMGENAKNITGKLKLFSLVNNEPDTLNLNNLSMGIGEMNIKGDVTLVSNKNEYNAYDLNIDTLNLDKLMPQSNSSETRWSRTAIDTSFLHVPKSKGKINAKNLMFNKEVFENASIDFDIADNVLSINALKAKAYKGNISASGKIKGSEDPLIPMDIIGQIGFKNISLNDWVRKVIKAPSSISGIGDVVFNFKTSGLSPSALILDLDGEGKLASKEVIVRGFDFNRLKEQLQQKDFAGLVESTLVSRSLQSGETKFDDVSIPYQMSKGVINTQNFNVNSSAIGLTGSGKIDLPAWTISIDGQSVFKNKDKIPNFNFSLSGDLDNPSLSFKTDAIQNYLKDKIQNLISKGADKKFSDVLKNVIVPETVQSAPASNDNEADVSIPVEVEEAVDNTQE